MASFDDPVFKPYAEAIGQVALTWNTLHQSLSLIFSVLIAGGDYGGQLLAMWQSLKVDRAQRAILLASVKNSVPDIQTTWPKIAKDIEWICGKITSLEDARDNAIHTPFWGFKRSTNEIIVMPVIGLGHVRAAKLWSKDILKEFHWLRDSSLKLHEFAKEIYYCLISENVRAHGLPVKQLSWPERPQMPNRGETNESRSPPRQVDKAKPPSRPKSSPQ